MFGTKTDKGKQNHVYLTALANRGLYLRNLKKTGYPLEKWRMSTVEFQTMVLAEQIIEQSEINSQVEIKRMLMASLGLKME